ncbi:MAG: hypothetical protein GY749_26290 [Desulfobacteraceae bacterium]|nr:hypothetical protein [Desulfobacteraceae bacterium]
MNELFSFKFMALNINYGTKLLLRYLPVGKLNLLTGINGKGKSTVFQSLLLMRQSTEHSRATNKIILNGNCITLGNFLDAKNYRTSQDETIEFGLSVQKDDNYLDLYYIIRKDIDDEMVANIEKFTLKGVLDKETIHFKMLHENGVPVTYHDESYDDESYGGYYSGDLLLDLFYGDDDDYYFSKFIKENINLIRIHYVSADRIGPQDYYAKQSLGDFPNVGKKGEYTANILSKMKGDSVYEQLCLESGDTDTVLDQTEAWLRMIFGGGKINIQSVDANIILMQMNSEDTPNLYRPVNIGFGYSYVLPIIVSGLIGEANLKGEIDFTKADKNKNITDSTGFC